MFSGKKTMTEEISQLAGNQAIQFGDIGQARSISANSGQQASGSHIFQVQIDSLNGGIVNMVPHENHHPPQPRPVPIYHLRPQPAACFLNRKEETKIALDALSNNQSVEFYGSPGIGRTALLKHLAYHPAVTPAFPDGIVYLSKSQPVSDLLQEIFETFYDTALHPFHATEIQIRHALKDKKALVLLDIDQLTQQEVEQLINYLLSLTFIFASSECHLCDEVHPVVLHGLAVNHALMLVEKELGRSLSLEERPDAEAICKHFDGHPERIREAIGRVKAENLSLSMVARQLQSATSTTVWTEQLLASLPQKPHRIMLSVLAAFGGVGLLAEQAESLTGFAAAKSVLETLLQRNLVQVDGLRYSISSTILENWPQKWHLKPWRELAITYFTTWVQQHQGLPKLLGEETEVILKTLDWAVVEAQWSDVLILGRSVEGVLALSGQWGRWELVLRTLLQAARATRDQVAEAFALHQLGTRSLCLGETSLADDALMEALYIRQELLNDLIGAQATRHNLKFLQETLLPLQSQSQIDPPDGSIDTGIPPITTRLREDVGVDKQGSRGSAPVPAPDQSAPVPAPDQKGEKIKAQLSSIGIPLVMKRDITILLLVIGGLLFLIFWAQIISPLAQSIPPENCEIPIISPTPKKVPEAATMSLLSLVLIPYLALRRQRKKPQL